MITVGAYSGRLSYNSHVVSIKLSSRLGRGGMAEVWRGSLNGRDAAIKLLKTAAPEEVRALENEAGAIKMLCSEYLPQYYSHGLVDINGAERYFLAIENIEGESLHRFCVREAAPFPTAMAVRATYDIARGLSAVHAGGLVHADVKPENAMINRDKRRLQLCDFSFASENNRLYPDIPEGNTYGTKVFLSLNRVIGLPPTFQDDNYALGLTLFELLTGKLPIKDPRMDGNYDVIGRLDLGVTINGLSGFPHFLKELLFKMTGALPTGGYDPVRAFQNATEVVGFIESDPIACLYTRDWEF
jgi:serine/threonine protein kinase